VSNPYTPFPQSDDQGAYGQPPPGSGWAPGTTQGYLQGGPVGFGEAISQAFKNILEFNGRASRSAYWWFALFTFLITIVVDIISAATGAKALQYAFSAVIFLVSLALQIRRLHDTNRSGFWVLLDLTIIGGIVVFIFNLLPGTRGPNKFG